jgi:NAD(P)-dependent dehydrogenase (short-subunit alcohol dehydrogenase family)
MTVPQRSQVFAPGLLDRQVAVVTGAAQGIGAAVAETLATLGARIVAVDRADGVAEAAAALPGGGHVAVNADLTDDVAATEVARVCRDVAGRADVLVNCAGVALLAPAFELERTAWQKTLDLNLTAVFELSRAIGEIMREQGYGRIVSIASQGGVVALERHVAYTASKAALIGMTKVLAAEWAQHGITVNAVSPTVVDTELGRTAWEGEPGERMRAAIPVGRFADTDEVAQLVAYLSTPAAAMVTGENVVIDGGYTVV